MAKKIYLSPSDQGKNTYAAGNTNEEVQCEKISNALEQALLRCGFEVKNALTGSMQERVAESNAWNADLHIPIHTNAHNASVTGTRLFCYNLTGEGYKACTAVFKYLAPLTPGTSENISARPELYEVRVSSAPCVYIEVDFHDVPNIALWLIQNTEAIAEAICKGVCEYFGAEYVAPVGTDSGNGSETYIGEGADWSAESRKWAVDNGIIRGKGYGADGKPDFAWGDTVTREEMAVMLDRLAQAIG